MVDRRQSKEETHSTHCDNHPVSIQKRIIVPNYQGEKLVGILHETGSKEVLIICHGIKSSKDCIPMVNLAAAVQNIGVSVFRFDFSGNGESEGLFRYGNYRREAEELRAVVQHFRGIGRAITSIIGHSKGGNVVLLYASKYQDVCSVVNISGRFDLAKGMEGRLGKDFLEKIKRDGYIDVKNRRGKFLYRVTEESLMDRLSTDIRAACQSIHGNCRVLTVHGSKDQMVPVKDAIEFDRVIPNHVLRIIEGADHEFTLYQDELASVVIDFIKGDIDLSEDTMKHLPTRVNGDASGNSRL